jgi:hypothetical protein
LVEGVGFDFGGTFERPGDAVDDGAGCCARAFNDELISRVRVTTIPTRVRDIDNSPPA